MVTTYVVKVVAIAYGILQAIVWTLQSCETFGVCISLCRQLLTSLLLPVKMRTVKLSSFFWVSPRQSI